MQTQYDELIKNATTKFLPGADWRLLKAQLCQESSLKCDAISPTGAEGIAQFMPGTWRDVSEALNMPRNSRPNNPIYAIPAAAYYMSELCAKWSAEREESDRYMLALASYNAGFGNLLKAQKLAGCAAEYHPIIQQLESVTGVINAQETTHYVQNIFKIFGEYLMQGR